MDPSFRWDDDSGFHCLIPDSNGFNSNHRAAAL